MRLRTLFRNGLLAGAAVAGLAACGSASAPGSSAATAAARAPIDAPADTSAGGGSVSTPTGGGAADAQRTSAATSPMNGGTRELVNPDANTVVFLYYELAHLPLPIDTWVEEDRRVKYAPAPDKAPHRIAVRSELQSAAAAVKNVGTLRLTMNANLSDYDPAYGEFTVRALSPSSVVSFDALGQKVQVNFKNGRTAQIWHVPPSEAQPIRDKIGYAGNVEMDVLLRIVDVLPGPGGGTITTEIVEYELREAQRGVALARVQPR